MHANRLYSAAMKVLILGAGAVGLALAAKLSKVCEVRAVARDRYASAIGSGGFLLSGLWGEGRYDFPVGSSVPPGERYDYAIVTAKSGGTEALCREHGWALGGAETVSLQNGVGNEEILARYAEKVIGGMIITGFEWRSDSAVHVSVEAGPIKLGRFPQGLDAPVERLVELFRGAGLDAIGSAAIRAELWAKTLYNCALNPLGALNGVPYGRLTEPSAWRVIEGIVLEGFSVIEAEGLSLAWAGSEDYLAYLREVQIPATAEHHSSMLQDLARGRPTEIDFLNGAIVARGAAHGIATPVNSCIVDLVRFRESLGRDQTYLP
jgi:2-dehydropantoate 2-reductase